MSIIVVTDPAETPISRAEVKTHLRIDTTAEDDYIDSLIEVAVDMAQERLRRQLVTATRKLLLDDFPDNGIAPIELEFAPLRSVGSVKYYTDDTLTTLATSKYQVDTSEEPGRVKPVDGEFWPSTDIRMNAVEITYDCGYGAATDVPDFIKHILKLICSHFYENRDSVVVGNNVSAQVRLPAAIESMINLYSLRNVY